MSPAGGYQRPENPAPVSGPGAMSRRTDGQPIRDPGGLPYGDNAELRSVQQAAPMAEAGRPVQQPRVPLTQMTPGLFDQSDYPAEPVTAGMPFGDGPGMPASDRLPNGPTRERLIASLPAMLRAAESPYVSPEFRALVAYIRSVVSG